MAAALLVKRAINYHCHEEFLLLATAAPLPYIGALRSLLCTTYMYCYTPSCGIDWGVKVGRGERVSMNHDCAIQRILKGIKLAIKFHRLVECSYKYRSMQRCSSFHKIRHNIIHICMHKTHTHTSSAVLESQGKRVKEKRTWRKEW